jgi:hypothetical protein
MACGGGNQVCGLAAVPGWLVLAYGGRPARNCEAASEVTTVRSLSPGGRFGPTSLAGTGYRSAALGRGDPRFA